MAQWPNGLSRLALSFAALGLAALAPAARAQTQDVYVTNYRSNTISRFAGTGPGTFSTTATTLTDPTMRRPYGLALDAKGDLFATNNSSYTITEFSAGATPGTFGVTTTLTDSRLTNLAGLTFDARRPVRRKHRFLYHYGVRGGGHTRHLRGDHHPLFPQPERTNWPSRRRAGRPVRRQHPRGHHHRICLQGAGHVWGRHDLRHRIKRADGLDFRRTRRPVRCQ